MSCEIAGERPFFCPTKWQLWQQIISLLPRGRAWQTHEHGTERIVASESSQLGIYELGSTGLGTEPVVERLSVMQQFWAAYAEVLEYLHQRACALLEEFFCSTTRELRIEWGREYGFPDECEPWDTLCDKVRSTGGATCAYLAALASRNGWHVECQDCANTRMALADAAVADCTPLDCECEAAVIRIRIITELSPAWTRPVPFNADAAVADCTPPCPPVPDVVRCLIERWKPAHVRAIYEVI